MGEGEFTTELSKEFHIGITLIKNDNKWVYKRFKKCKGDGVMGEDV